MKKFLFFLLIVFSVLPAVARHITGGEIIYNCIGPGSGPNTKSYTITLRLFRDNDCTNCAQMPPSVSLGIFNNDNNTLFGGYRVVSLTSTEPVPILAAPLCIINTPPLNYSVGYYTFNADLPDNFKGYTITYQTCCRVNGIINIGLAEKIGATYVGSIPGSQTLPSGTDNSARFQIGISIICHNKPFTLNFSAEDSNGDSLVYSMQNAYNGGDAIDASYSTPAAPPYASVPYSIGYSGSFPLGFQSSINTSTGIISGIAPGAGEYIVCVLVRSYRNGTFIAEHRKDFIITVADCDFASSELNPVYTSCDGYTVNFQNLNTSPLNLTFDWDFGEIASGANNTSVLPMPSHTYLSAGDYILTLIVNRNTSCADTATAIVRVYPGFFPAFAPIPSQCKNTPVQFNDATTAAYGSVNYWRWDFGVQTLSNDTSRLQNPTYTYTAAGTYLAEFIVATSKGCRDTLYPIVTIVDKPNFFISNDTLICTVDTLQLHSNVTNGTITWSPNSAINDIHSFNPLVSPDITTTYTAFYQDVFGCTDTKQVKVSVVNEVTLLKANDTTLCRTDSAVLHLSTDALYFNWMPTNVILDPTVRNPVIFPTAPLTKFSVRASISNKCFKLDTVLVKTVPYPIPLVTGPLSICYGKDAQLNASGGSSYLWTPSIYLNSTTIPNPRSVRPKLTLTYTVTVRDTLGCPKPVSKDFTLNVIRIFADAGPSDTSVVLGQSLALQATGGLNYLWTPATYLNNPNIASPVSLPQNNITYTVRVSDNTGCFASDTINVKVFFLPPDLYVPSAFTPGGNNQNDLFRPIALGIRSLESFRVYNRWGVLLYTTNIIGEGWNGKYKNVEQESATYVWQAYATDYKGRKIFRKGSVILIR